MPTIINQSTHAMPLPGDGEVLGPYEVAEVTRQWLKNHPSHRLKLPEEYNQMIRGLDRDDLIAHIKVRREHTDEDLTAQGETDELREQLLLDEPETEAAAE